MTAGTLAVGAARAAWLGIECRRGRAGGDRSRAATRAPIRAVAGGRRDRGPRPSVRRLLWKPAAGLGLQERRAERAAQGRRADCPRSDPRSALAAAGEGVRAGRGDRRKVGEATTAAARAAKCHACQVQARCAAVTAYGRGADPTGTACPAGCATTVAPAVAPAAAAPERHAIQIPAGRAPAIAEQFGAAPAAQRGRESQPTRTAAAAAAATPSAAVRAGARHAAAASVGDAGAPSARAGGAGDAAPSAHAAAAARSGPTGDAAARGGGCRLARRPGRFRAPIPRPAARPGFLSHRARRGDQPAPAPRASLAARTRRLAPALAAAGGGRGRPRHAAVADAAAAAHGHTKRGRRRVPGLLRVRAQPRRPRPEDSRAPPEHWPLLRIRGASREKRRVWNWTRQDSVRKANHVVSNSRSLYYAVYMRAAPLCQIPGTPLRRHLGGRKVSGGTPEVLRGRGRRVSHTHNVIARARCALPYRCLADDPHTLPGPVGPPPLAPPARSRTSG